MRIIIALLISFPLLAQVSAYVTGGQSFRQRFDGSNPTVGVEVRYAQASAFWEYTPERGDAGSRERSQAFGGRVYAPLGSVEVFASGGRSFGESGYYYRGRSEHWVDYPFHAWFAGAGAKVPIAKRLFLLGEYRRIVDQQTLNRLTLKPNVWQVGLSFQF